jgi:methyl-accepting chemotaxis protein
MKEDRFKKESLVPFLLLTVIMGLFLVYAIKDYQSSRQETIKKHKELLEKEHHEKKEKIESVFRQLYQGIRTMSLLPAIQAIDKYGKNLTDNGHMTIQQIYNNIAVNTGVSEIYAVDIDMDPEQIDPNTGELMGPIFTYDELIVGKRGDFEEAEQEGAPEFEEVEIYEYREMRKQISYFKKHYPSVHTISGLDVPGVISKDVITCDNSDFTAKDLAKGDNSKRNGLVYSVPFYSNDGALKGIMSGVIRSEVLRRYIGTGAMGLINAATDYYITFGDSKDIFHHFDKTGKFTDSSPALFAETLKLDIVDQNEWKLIYYIPMDQLSSQFAEIRNNLIIRLIFVLVIFGAGSFFIYMNSSLQKMFTEMAKVAGKIAEGDLSLDFKPKSDRDVIGKALFKVKNDLSYIVGNILASSENVTSGADEISAGNQHLAQRSQEQASFIAETSATVEQITSNIRFNAENADKANQLARKTSEAAKEGGQVVEKTIQQMQAVTESSRQIADIINTVNEIAFQTNLLALNAAVEAARAGEQGRGFAVVAGEVRNLAGRSAQAAKEIQSLIKDSVEKIEVGNKLVEETGSKLKTIIESVQNVADNISEISSASQDQSVGIVQVNKAIVQMDEVVQQNASLVEQAAATSENLSGEAKEMKRLMRAFKINSSEIQSNKHTNRGVTREKGDAAKTFAEEKQKGTDLSDNFEVF